MNTKKQLVVLIVGLVLIFCVAAQGKDGWTIEDFPGCFDGKWDTKQETHELGDGLSVTVLSAALPGPTVYVVAGIHGDEVAAWQAGNLLRQVSLKSGTLAIVSPADPYGAQHEQRRTKDGWDLNRQFPGDEHGNDAQRIAASIFADIGKRSPKLVLDLHETLDADEGRDKLGNGLICQSLNGMDDLVLSLLHDSETGSICSAPLTLFGSPPQGSLNQTLAQQLGIACMTVETLRTDPLSQRVRNQLEIADAALRYYGMIE